MSNAAKKLAMDDALKMFDNLRGQDIIIVTAYRHGSIRQEEQTFECAFLASPDSETLTLKMSDGLFTDIEPARCRPLNPQYGLAKGEDVYDHSVVVGFAPDRACSVLYRIFLCVKRLV